MTRLTSIIAQQIENNVDFVPDYDSPNLDIELIGADLHSNGEPLDISRFFMMAHDSITYNTVILGDNPNKKRAITSIPIGDRWTTKWLTNNSNPFFDDFDRIGICRFFHNVDYLQSKVISFELEKIEISIFSGIDVDQHKEDCLYSHFQWHNSFGGAIERKAAIMDSFYWKIREGQLDSADSVMELRSLLIGAKLANDPSQLW